ncbi:MAG: S8 family serine peptidase [Bradyrhizobiaceae bacterium]|nr:S8 family serine peptidase [Bradyrhizobiaceae bacterium]
MSHAKHLVGSILILLCASVLHAQPIRLTTVDGVEMVANCVKVQFAEPLTSDAMIPPGFSLHHKYLQSDVPPMNTFYKAPSHALTRAIRELSRCAVLRYDAPMDPVQAARMLAKFDQITYAEPWYTMQVAYVPNDPMVSEQEALTVLKMTEAWDIEQGSESVVVAVIDNGVDQTHEDLKTSIAVNSGEIPGNFIDDDNNGAVDDYNGYNLAWEDDGTQPGVTYNNGAGGHGTNVAGIVSATTNNALGIAGIANRCKLFPIKAAPVNTGSIVYGYEGMIYAAQRGFKVINCSWGSQSRSGFVKPYSFIDKSVVDYCLAMGSMIVSSAGNHGNGIGGAGWLEFNYPAAYDGVMGVGECNTSHKVASTSGLGRNAWVMAPSTNAVTTSSGGGYTSAGISGTSFASPMGAGAAALIRSHWPALTPRQVAALLRATAIDIRGTNPGVAKSLPGRISVLDALRADPSAMPGFRLVSQRIVVGGTETARYANGDTLQLYMTIANDLAASQALTCAIRILDPAGWEVVPVVTTVQRPALGAGEQAEVGPFTVVVNRHQDKPCFMDLTVLDASHEQRMFAYIEPPATMTTFANDQLSYSIGDHGMFAFGSTFASNMVGNGTGFGWKPTFQDLGWTGGLVFCTGDGRVLRAYDNAQDKPDFRAEKPFAAPEANRAILTDSAAGDREIGVRIHERCTFPSSNGPTTIIAIEVENRTAAPLQDVAAGYFFDWDIGPNGQNNKARLAPEALPTSFKSMGEAEMFYRDNVPVVVVCAAVSSEASIQGQAAGMMMLDYVDDADRFSDADVVTLLTSGTSVQTNMLGDACGVVGMRFPGELAPGERKKFMIVIGVGTSQEEAATNVREAILSPNSVSDNVPVNASLWPNPTGGRVTVQVDGSIRSVTITDLLGNMVQRRDGSGLSTVHLELSGLSTGRYHAMLETDHGIVTLPLLLLN